MSASFEEKSVWIQLAGIVVGLGGYFVLAGQLLARGVRDIDAYQTLFSFAIVALVIYLIVGHVLAAISGRVEDADERDRQIAWRSGHRTSWIVAVGALGAVICMLREVENVWTANLLLLSLAVAEVANLLLRVWYYRRGV